MHKILVKGFTNVANSVSGFLSFLNSKESIMNAFALILFLFNLGLEVAAIFSPCIGLSTSLVLELIITNYSVMLGLLGIRSLFSRGENGISTKT